MEQVTEPVSPQDLYAEVYGVVCDAVERAWQNWPVERGPDEAPVMHTSEYARAAANRVLDAFAEIRDVDTRVDGEIVVAEQEFFDRLWYHRATTGSRTAADLAVAEEGLRRVEAENYEGLVPANDFELGVIHGKLSALRWVLGHDWDMLDT